MAIMLLDSLRKHSNDERLDVCVIDDFVTHTSIHRWYTQHQADCKFNIVFKTFPKIINHILLISGFRYFLFDMIDTSMYDGVLYIDTDVLVRRNIIETIWNPFLRQVPTPHPNHAVYAKRENGHRIYHCQLHTDSLFEKFKDTCFSAGIFLLDLRGSHRDTVKHSFEEVVDCMRYHSKGPNKLVCCDQPIFHVVCHIRNLMDTSFFETIISINGKDPTSGHTLYHFAGNVGHSESKLQKMKEFIHNS